MFRKNCLKDRINGVHKKATKKTREANYFHEKSIPQKGIPKNVSMIVHRKDIKKRNSKLKKNIFYRKCFSQKPIPKNASMGCAGKILKNRKGSLKNHVRKKFSQNVYQWGYTRKIKRTPNQEEKNSRKNHFHKKISQISYQGGYTEKRLKSKTQK